MTTKQTFDMPDGLEEAIEDVTWLDTGDLSGKDRETIDKLIQAALQRLEMGEVVDVEILKQSAFDAICQDIMAGKTIEGLWDVSLVFDWLHDQGYVVMRAKKQEG